MPHLRHASRTLATAAGLIALAALGMAPPTPPASADQPAPDQTALELERRYWADIEPLLARSCLGCHNADKNKGGVRLDNILTLEDALDLGDTLALARELIGSRQMPPEDEPPLTDHEILTVQQWIDATLDYVPADGQIDPGWFTIHRLNRTEYRNTLRDLLGIDPHAHDLAAGLPADDTGYGFDNNAAVLSMSPLQIEAYLDAAEKALDIALGPAVEPSKEPRRVRGLTVQGGGRAQGRGGHMFFSNGTLAAQVDIPVTGEYEIAVSTWGTRAGDELPRLSVRVDRKEVHAAHIAADENSPQTETVRLRLERGSRRLAAAFTNDFYLPNVADRNLAIESVTIAGPLSLDTIERPESYRTIFFTPPVRPTEQAERDNARDILERFATRAFRRPAKGTEVNDLLRLYTKSRLAGDSHEESIRLSLSAILVSPAFLYRSVEHPAPDDPAAVHTLSPHELASRLSYFLWSAPPDDSLLAAAADASLTTDEGLANHTRRMLADPKADAFIENFAGQWLLLRNLDRLAIDPARFPDYNSELRQDMITEATLFFGDVVRNDLPVTSLIDADHTFINRPLAALYGFADLAASLPESGFQRVDLPQGSPRGGVLTMGAVLTVTSNPTRTSPVKRGHYVLDQILGTPPPPPPPDIPPLEQANAPGDHASLREQLKAHLLDATCTSCHVRMDPIGLAMENFDAIGRWRDADESGPIDASGVLPGDIAFAGPNELKGILLDRQDLFVENLTRKLLTYALGRGVEPFDRPTVTAITRAAAERDHRMSALIEGIVQSQAFRTCRGVQP
jgi:hypothetical protein